jgi:hypothetical protein
MPSLRNVQPHKPLDPSIIDTAPDETPESQRNLISSQEREIWQLIASLQNRLETVSAENEELKAKVDLDTEKAKLARPYANKVFAFLCVYSLSVFGILLLCGSGYRGFSLSDQVLSFLVSSTAVSAIGLVHTVVKGLFGPLRR